MEGPFWEEKSQKKSWMADNLAAIKDNSAIKTISCHQEKRMKSDPEKR